MADGAARRRRFVRGALGLAAGPRLAGLASPGAAFAQASAGSVPRLATGEAGRQLAGGGWVLMMRHEQTVPGIGDPPNFRLDDCSTQRNLSDLGRLRARRAGHAIREAGIELSRVRAGRWCRTRDTAQLAFGQYEIWTALDSFFGSAERADAQRDAVLDFVRAMSGPGNVMLVTHQVNITTSLGVYPEMGEVVAARVEHGVLRPRLSFVPGSA
jgi:phosphohistidine phosphatase SixA